jgi:hypothetical protein
MANRVFKFLIIGLLSSALTQAQGPGPLPRHPGDVIKYEIKFDGPNADKIKSVNAGLNLRTSPPKDQVGFGTNIPDNGVSPSPSKTFELIFKVPENAANGDYYLYVSAIADEGSGNYNDGQEFNTPPIRIENPKTFTPPGITVKPLP